MTEERVEGTGLIFFHFEPGERARIKRNRYSVSQRTPLWTDGYNCTVIRNNDATVSVSVAGYEDEKHYIDEKDLVPLDYLRSTERTSKNEHGKPEAV